MFLMHLVASECTVRLNAKRPWAVDVNVNLEFPLSNKVKLQKKGTRELGDALLLYSRDILTMSTSGD